VRTLCADGYDVVNVKADEDAFMTFKYVSVVARAARGLKDLVLGSEVAA